MVAAHRVRAYVGGVYGQSRVNECVVDTPAAVRGACAAAVVPPGVRVCARGIQGTKGVDQPRPVLRRVRRAGRTGSVVVVAAVAKQAGQPSSLVRRVSWCTDGPIGVVQVNRAVSAVEVTAHDDGSNVLVRADVLPKLDVPLPPVGETTQTSLGIGCVNAHDARAAPRKHHGKNASFHPTVLMVVGHVGRMDVGRIIA